MSLSLVLTNIILGCLVVFLTAATVGIIKSVVDQFRDQVPSHPGATP